MGSRSQYPGSPDYPSIDQWQALNSSVSGKLIKFSNPGQTCYGSSFNKDSCARFNKQNSNASFIGESPSLINWPQFAGDPCPPLSKVDNAGPADGCVAGKFPEYVVAARNAEDVSEALKWAAKMGVRVVVKNTGYVKSKICERVLRF
jgi:hypothetical protein